MTGIDLSREMLALARRRAAELGREVDLEAGDAKALTFPDQRFDTLVVTLALCSIPGERRALAEANRVLRAGGSCCSNTWQATSSRFAPSSGSSIRLASGSRPITCSGSPAGRLKPRASRSSMSSARSWASSSG
jgi:ubiquinone/menaquinone biosynthesis C-methylase UbiE